jgi:hypothetical protein
MRITLARGKAATMNTAIAGRLAALIGLAQQLKLRVEAERPGSLLPTFPLMRAGIDVNGIVNALEMHLDRLAQSPR